MSRIDRRGFIGTTLIGSAAVAAQSSAAPAAAPADDGDTSTIGRTPNTKFAVNVEMWWSRLPFLDRVRAAAALGFPAIEFWPWESKDVAAIADLTGELGLEVAQFTAWGFTPGMNDPANHDHFIETIEASCQAAKTLRCKKMTVVGGNDQPGMTQEEMHENIIVALRRAAPIAERHDVMLILEPMNIRVDHKGHCLYGGEAPVRICREVDSSHVKLNWDLYHMQITEGDLCRRLKEGFDQVGYLQLADNPGRNEPGTGEVYYNRVLRAAQQLGYDDYVGLECRPLDDEVTAARRVAAADIW